MQNCKCSFDSAPLHRSTNLFPNSKSPSPTLPISLDPDFVFLSTFPFPQQFKKSLSPPPEHSWRDEETRKHSRIALLDCLTLFSVLGNKKSLLHSCMNVETPRKFTIKALPLAFFLFVFLSS
ncbi:hypothetical protein NC652_007035 [Populus alba x Populus x berolinensis]|nr:hypothetical protein NC652_007035 [Populus alba x Populus x berolinensis]